MKYTSDSEYKPISEINMIPLIDIMLVLLIIFMITAPLSISNIDLKLPKSSVKSNNSISKKDIIITLDEKKRYFIGDINIDKENLLNVLKSMIKIQDNKKVYIKADKNIKYGIIIDIMSLAKKAGALNISMLTEAK